LYNVIACVISVIVKASSGPRYVVGCRSKVDKEKLTAGTRVVLDMTTLTIMRALPREVSYHGRLNHWITMLTENVCG
jgi:ATP-dependent 26S proteasome regulatory subunit